MIKREEIFAYVKEKYNVEEKYPLPTAPTYPVLQHPDNLKWFALIQDVERKKLGLVGEGKVDIISVKLKELAFVEYLQAQEGYFKGYSFHKGNWISILMDGSVPFKEICNLIDESYEVTGPGKKKREAKEWLVPANPKYYDVEHLFEEKEEAEWKQGNGIKEGDTVYMYVAAPVSAILYQCLVIKTNIPYHYMDKNLTIKSLMKLRLQKRYRKDQFPLSLLKEKYGIASIRGPRYVPYLLSQALKAGD